MLKLTVGQSVTLGFALAGSFAAQGLTTVNDAIVITEFFETLRLVDPAVPTATPMYFSPANPPGVESLPGQLLLEPAGTLLFTQASFIRRYDPATGIITYVAEAPSFIYRNIALEADGSVIATTGVDLYRINPATGETTSLSDSYTFFSPRKLSIAPDGAIFVIEFFRDLVKIDPITLAFETVPVDRDYSLANAIEALPNGDLAVIDQVNDIYIVDPLTGNSRLVSLDIELTGVRGSAIGTNGDLLVATLDAVFQVDLQSGASTLLTPTLTLFSPYDVVQGNITIPEPASAALLAIGLGMFARRRRG